MLSLIILMLTLSKKLVKHFKVNNKIIGSIDICDLAKADIEIPNEQRLKLKNKVDNIVNYHDLYFKEKKYFNFQGNINIHYCCETKKNYLVDGQHRYFAIIDLVEKHKYKNQLVTIEIVKVDTLEEVRINFEIINKNTKMPKFPKDLNKSKIEKVCGKIFDKYPDFWSESTRPQKPNINQTYFQEGVAFLFKELNISFGKELSEKELLKIILDKNKELSKKDLNKIPHLSKLKTKEKIINKCEEGEFYFGIYQHKSNDSCYGWVREILDSLNKKDSKKRKKQKIPPTLKNKVWLKYIGDKAESKCMCCNENKISLTSFHCGHVKSEAKGGKLTVANMRPICGSCNSSMGTQNMKDYAKKFYSDVNRLDL